MELEFICLSGGTKPINRQMKNSSCVKCYGERERERVLCVCVVSWKTSLRNDI